MATGPDQTAPIDTALDTLDPSLDAGLEADWADPAQRAELPPARPDQLRRFDLALGAIALVLTLATVATLLPGFHLVIVNGRLDLVLNTLTAVAAAGAAALAWIRYRIEREVSALFESAAFLVLFTTRTLLVWISIFGLSAQIGLGIEAPEQWPIYGWTISRLATAALLIVAASATLSRARRAPRWKFLVQVGPAFVVLGLIVILSALEPELPALVTPAGFQALTGAGRAVPVMNLARIAIQVVVALVYLGGARLYREVYRQPGRRYAGFVAIALLVAGFAQLNWALLPGISQGGGTADDLLPAPF